MPTEIVKVPYHLLYGSPKETWQDYLSTEIPDVTPEKVKQIQELWAKLEPEWQATWERLEAQNSMPINSNLKLKEISDKLGPSAHFDFESYRQSWVTDRE